MKLLIACILGVTLLTAVYGHNESEFMTAEEKLWKELGTSSPHLRPVVDHTDTVNVTLGFSLIDILEVNEKQGYIHVEAWLKMKWVAPNMMWDPDQYDKIREIKIPIEKIWQPDIRLFNGGFDGLQVSNSYAVVSAAGQVLWVPQATAKASCVFDMRSFPYDRHECMFKFGSWVYHGDEIDLNLFGHYYDMDLSNFGLHLEWDIHNTSATRGVKQYACCAEPYHDVTFNLHLKRKSSYFSYVYFTPMILIALMSPFMFLLPYRQSQRFSLGGSLLVCLVVLLVGLDAVFPATFEGVPLVGVYYMSVIVLLLCCMIVSAIILNLTEKVTTPPRFLKTVIGEGLGRLLCVKRESYSTLVENEGEDGVQMRKADDVSWRYIASVLDRFFFFIYIIFTIILAVALATPR